MEAIKSSRDHRAPEIKLSTLPLLSTGVELDFPLSTDRQLISTSTPSASFFAWTRWINSFVIRDAVVKEKNSLLVSFFPSFFGKPRVFGIGS